MESKIMEARKLFDGNFNCAQSALSVFDLEFGISREKLQHLSSGFGAGMCYQGMTCGAVAGAYMALGLISGKKFHEPEMIKENTFQLIKVFNKKFIEKHGSTICKELLQFDISTVQGIEIARQNGVFENRCPNFVPDAVAMIESQIK
jgi:C_GCAxxG_C_C family probable redox protein